MPLATLGLVLALVIVLLYNTIKILKEYERGVIFFLGRFQSVKGPGLIILIPGLQKMVKVDLRVIVMDVPTQDVISRDNVSVKVNAVIYFRIVDPEKAIIRVANVFEATSYRFADREWPGYRHSVCPVPTACRPARAGPAPIVRSFATIDWLLRKHWRHG